MIFPVFSCINLTIWHISQTITGKKYLKPSHGDTAKIQHFQDCCVSKCFVLLWFEQCLTRAEAAVVIEDRAPPSFLCTSHNPLTQANSPSPLFRFFYSVCPHLLPLSLSFSGQCHDLPSTHCAVVMKAASTKLALVAAHMSVQCCSLQVCRMAAKSD